MGRRGPKPKGEYVDKSATLSTRISAELRAQLEGAVRSSGLKLSRVRWNAALGAHFKMMSEPSRCSVVHKISA